MRVNREITSLPRRSRSPFPFLAGTMFVIWVVVSSAYSQATYSDVWLDDTNMTENGDGAYIVASGVTEVDYTYEDAVEVETTITSPSGRTATSYSWGTTSAQANAQLSWDGNDEGDYFVNVTHQPLCFYEDCSYGQVCPVDPNGYDNGTLWWFYGYRRCSNPFTVASVFPVRIALDAYSLLSETWVGGQFGHGVCDYDPTCYGYCTQLTGVGGSKLTQSNCSIYLQCRALVVGGRCLNAAKICFGRLTKGVCS